jgi:serine phosphatase RsbU (regulator of sigma subunit)/anti-anti-sigma regulatory factor
MEIGSEWMTPDTKPVILVVDDDAVTRTVVRAGLARTGAYQVLEARDGAAAQQILREHAVDVVVTDLMMPGLNGIDLIRWANEQHIAPMWIILSGLGTFDAAVEAIQVGAFDFLAKPPGVPELDVSVRNALERRRLTEERDRLFSALAAESAIIHRDLQRAEVIQRALLPSKPPQIDGYSVNALYSPGNHVGGDLYNVIRVGPRHLVLFVADATGHGVSSAMLSVLFNRHLTVRNARGEPLAPATVLERTNNALCAERVGAGLFVTAAYCLVDLESGNVRFAAGGHPPVVLRTASGAMRRFARTGPVLGLAAATRYGETVIQLGQSDRLLLFTDGLLHHDEAGQWHVIEKAIAAAEPDGRTVLQSLFDDSRRAAGNGSSEGRDDTTLLLLQAAPGVSHFNNVGGNGARAAGGSLRATSVWYGERGNECWLQIRGRGTWLDCDAFHDTAVAIAEDSQPVVVDLSQCEYLDSTFLGTIHELVAVHGVRVQGLTPQVRATFEELDMRQVLHAADAPAVDVPEEMHSLSSVIDASASSKDRILRAHEVLSSLSERNRSKFKGVVEMMRGYSS